MIRSIRMLVLALLFLAPAFAAPAQKTVDIGDGITLHYIDEGKGPAVIFVHGSLSDAGYWWDQVHAFAAHYHAIAYSRRYNWPNHNPARPGYSAVTDSEDLARLIRTLHLGKVYVVGHSYGALTALFLAARHPDLLNAEVLAEPPAVPLLKHARPDGEAMYRDIESRMVEPMTAAFRAEQSERGVSIFIDYVFADPRAWEKMKPKDRADTMRDAHEWEVMMTKGTLFPEITPEQVRAVSVPVLLMSGARSYPMLGAIDTELTRLIPHSQRIIFGDSGHQMWLQHPDQARAYAEAFFARHPAPP